MICCEAWVCLVSYPSPCSNSLATAVVATTSVQPTAPIRTFLQLASSASREVLNRLRVQHAASAVRPFIWVLLIVSQRFYFVLLEAMVAPTVLGIARLPMETPYARPRRTIRTQPTIY